MYVYVISHVYENSLRLWLILVGDVISLHKDLYFSYLARKVRTDSFDS